MSKVPSLGYEKVIKALRRDGWVVVRQKGSHIRLQKRTAEETLKKWGRCVQTCKFVRLRD
ncbi:MAG: type II toxin-antitoxin system HicA family toxin [Candidatus Aminicenantes bacterium]|nr:type II toxin-antitoxin system HicA family toxin [Candidatus Aminicenantes bacterium]